MTKQYIGDNLYELHIGFQKITLSTDEIDEVVDEFIETHEDFENLKEKIEDLKEIIEEKNEEIFVLTGQIIEYEGKSEH